MALFRQTCGYMYREKKNMSCGCTEEQGWIQDFPLGGGGGGRKRLCVPAHIRARSQKSRTTGVQGPLIRALEALYVFLMLSCAI